DSLKFLEEVTLRLSIFVYENPPAVSSMFFALFEQRCQARGDWNRSLLMVLRSEPDVLFLANMKLHLFKVNVRPRCILDLLLAASGSEKESITNSLFAVHRREQLFQLFLGERHRRVFLVSRQITGERKFRLNVVLVQ